MSLTPHDLLSARLQIERELQRAPHDRHHPWRTPVLATVDAQGLPQARTVVLRVVDASARRWRIYTDRRSPKVAELQAHPHAALVLWHPRAHLQLRAQVSVQVWTAGPLVNETWQRMRQAPSAGDYLSAQAPGSPLMVGDEPHPTPLATSDPADHHLAVIECVSRSWDALWLDRAGHRRAAWCFERINGDDAGRWLVP